MKRPKALQPGDTIGIVSPAGPLVANSLQPAIRLLQEAGFRVILGQHVYDRKGFLAGTDAARAADFIAMLQSDVQAIVCARGGYGSQRIIRAVYDYVTKSKPKWLVGYSDITALHSMVQKAGWVSVHGCMPSEWHRSELAFSFHTLLQMMQGHVQSVIPLPPDVSLVTLRSGRARGRLVGGNLTLVTTLLGTPYEVDTTDAILVLEDVGEQPYRIDRMLNVLQLAGKLETVQGIVFGDFTRCDPAEHGPDKTVEDVIRCFSQDMHVPVLSGFPVGHGRHNVPLPLGLPVELDADEGRLTLLSSPACTNGL